jgi:hypothetical protein
MSATEKLGPNADRELYELLGYLLTSARGLLEEPGEYGPLRLLEGASRLCGLMVAGGSSYGDTLGGLKSGIDAGKFSVMTDPEAFAQTLDRAVRDYTRRLD